MPEPYIEPSIDQIARKVRLAFLEAKGRQLKRVYKPSDRHDKMEFFRAAAQNVIALKCDPYDFINAAVRYCGVKGGPFPNQLGGQGARNWYRSWCSELNIPSEPVRVKVSKAGEPEVFEVKFACDFELQQDIEMTLRTLHNNTGSTDPRHPANAKILQDRFFELPIAARAILGDDQTYITFGREILEFFQTQPNYLDAARKLNLPIDATLKWISNHLSSNKS